jgi:hypothetical protein
VAKKTVTRTAPKPHPWVSNAGIKLLRRIQKHILANPKTYRQDQWHCGTAMCIAGHAAMMSGLALRASKTSDWLGIRIYCPVTKDGVQRDMDAWSAIAKRALGADSRAHNLFTHADNWPRLFANNYELAADYSDKAAVAVKRIDHWIKTGR